MRSCGECNVCCSILEVKELEKKFNQRCPHLCERGCGIYETRPQACREWFCVWVVGTAPDAERPDRSGVVLEQAHAHAANGKAGVMPVVAYEIRPGAFDSYWGDRMLKRLSRKLLIGLVPFGGEQPTRFIGPPEQLRADVEWVRAPTRD